MRTKLAIAALSLVIPAAPPACAAQPQLVKDINMVPNGVGGVPAGFAELDGQIYFVASSYRDGMELWRSDGTTEGTAVVKPFPYPGLDAQFTMATARLGNAVYFIADDGVSGRELWRTDGTAAGTVLVKDIRPGADSGMNYRTAIVSCNGNLLFAANDGVSGTELWVSDGTAAGTMMLKDIVSGAGSGLDNSVSLVSAGNFVFFQSAYNWLGRELWRSDGTAAGTVKLYTGVNQVDPLAVTGLPAVSFGGPIALTTVPLPGEAALKRFVRARLEPAP